MIRRRLLRYLIKIANDRILKPIPAMPDSSKFPCVFQTLGIENYGGQKIAVFPDYIISLVIHSYSFMLYGMRILFITSMDIRCFPEESS